MANILLNNNYQQRPQLPHFGILDRNDADYVFSSNKNGKRKPFFGGFSVTGLSHSGNDVEALKKENKLCMLCDGVMRDPVKTPCDHRSCRTCLEHWIYIIKSPVGTVLCPKYFDGTHNQMARPFTINECAADEDYINNESLEINFRSCPVKRQTNCSWKKGTLHDVYEHVNKQHSDLEASGRIGDYYESIRHGAGAGSRSVIMSSGWRSADHEYSDTEDEPSAPGATGYSALGSGLPPGLLSSGDDSSLLSTAAYNSGVVNTAPRQAITKDRIETLRRLFAENMTDELFEEFCADINQGCRSEYGATFLEMSDQLYDVVLQNNHELWTVQANTLCESREPYGSRVELEQSVGLPIDSSSRKDLLRSMFPMISGNGLDIIYRRLNQECQILRRKSLEGLDDAGCEQFLKDRVSVRGSCSKGLVHRLSNEELSDVDVSNIFDQYDINAETELARYVSDPRCEKTKGRTLQNPEAEETHFYRVGAFTCENDEQGRVINSKLGRAVFKQDSVNHQGTAYGSGLYTAATKTGCEYFAHEPYNQGKKVVILEITPRPDLPLVGMISSFILPIFPRSNPMVFPGSNPSLFPGSNPSVASGLPRLGMQHSRPLVLSGSTYQAILNNQCHSVGVIYKANPDYRLIKDPSSIKKITAFHPNMETKVHIPFTFEQIVSESLHVVRASKNKIKSHGVAPTILERCSIHDAGTGEIQEKTVYKYHIPLKSKKLDEDTKQFSTDDQLAAGRGLRSGDIPYEDKYYLIERKPLEYKRVKPEAPLNKSSMIYLGDSSRCLNPDDVKVFHLQYGRNEGVQNKDISELPMFIRREDRIQEASGSSDSKSEVDQWWINGGYKK